ncbi:MULTISPECIES: hypothetical protein [Providencia]|uniref:Uncharacterized protein n=1 Tax=Providencia rettgeri TaxID=587 RepID=A0AAJ6JXT0_PRORE|nr:MULTISPECIES: hypothetical protein [Providencia]WHT96029.1 hypothetical protein KOF27_22410 [Providencia rettgeri]WJM88606.1 hypothetical protein KOL64_22450 [Providencia rettgeri]
MSSHQNLAAPESNERGGKNLLTNDQKADLLHYIAPLTRLLDLFEGDISPELYDEEITLHSDAFDSNSIFMKDGYPIGFSDNLNNMFYLRPELIQAS